MDVEGRNKVVVVGNGFDISVGLKSSYKDFIEYIKERHHFSEDLELYEYNRLFLRKYEDFKLNWSDFESLYEETVRSVNNRVQHEDLQDSFEITVINDSIKKLERDFHDYISDEYQKWLKKNILPQYGSSAKKFSKNINPVIKDLLSDSDAFFINFNYTNTLEDLSEDIIFEKVMSDDEITDESERRAKANREIKKIQNRIAHIHGSIEDDNILFGGGFADREDTKNIHYSKSLLNDKLFRIKENDKLSSTRKVIMDELDKKRCEELIFEDSAQYDSNGVIEKNSNYKRENKFDLYIMGHSLQGSDFQFLSKILEDADRIFIFYYETDYTTKMEELIRRLGSSIIEKVKLVPFIEILFEDKLLINNFGMYQTIAPFLINKFPEEKILDDLSLTSNHFIFKHITDLEITNENVDIVLKLISSLNKKRIKTPIKKISFLGEMEEHEIESLCKSNALIEMFESVEKVSFEDTGISIDFLLTLIKQGNDLKQLIMNHCVFLNNNESEIDLSVCESLVRFEIKDCTFNPERAVQKLLFNSVKSINSLEKIIIEKNANIVIDSSVFGSAKNLLELSIVMSDTDDYENEVHLSNLELLYIDCSASNFPNITVGNEIKEITIVGYQEEFLSLSSLLKDNESLFGFPKFETLQLNSPDNITTFKNIDVDVPLDIFSKDIKLIIDEVSIYIDDYYKQYKFKTEESPSKSNTKEIIEETILNIINPNKKKNQRIFSEFKKWYAEISGSSDDSVDNEFLDTVKNHLLDADDATNISKDNSSVDKNIGASSKIEVKEKINFSEIDKLLFEYSHGKLNTDNLLLFLNKKGKSNLVIEVYKSVIDDLENKSDFTQLEVFDLKKLHFERAKLEIIKRFSEEWFVSSDQLDFSALEYERGMDPIPNLKKINKSNRFEEYKVLHPNTTSFKYLQLLKSAWQEVLDEKLLPLEEELRQEATAYE